MKQKTPATWSVIAIAKEDPAVIRRFIAWHLAIGARDVTIYFDDPSDPCIEMVGHLEQVRTVACTPEFWDSIGLTQDTRFTKRQNKAIRHGYDQTASDWVLNIDADELLYMPDLDIGQALANLDGNIRTLLVQPAERVEHLADTGRSLFRRLMTRDQTEQVYQDLSGTVIRNKGFVGHTLGKSFIRAGLQGFWMRQHYIQQRDGEKVIDKVVGGDDGAYLLHFFNRGYDDWRRKLDYRLVHGGYRHRMRALLQGFVDAKDEKGLRDVFERLHHIDDRQVDYLQQNGLLLAVEIDFAAIEATYF